MIDLLSTNWTWILIGLGLMVVFLFLYKAGVFDRRSKKVTLKSSLRDGDIIHTRDHGHFRYNESIYEDIDVFYDDNLIHKSEGSLDIVGIIRSSQN